MLGNPHIGLAHRKNRINTNRYSRIGNFAGGAGVVPPFSRREDD